MKSYIKFWGVHGSLPRPGLAYAKIGGNTSCLEIRCGKELIIIDAGTGIYELGGLLALRQAQGERVRATLLFSHYHWDHVIGLPFFLPIYNSKASFTLIGRKGLKLALNNLLKAPNFPVKLSDFKANIKLKEIRPSKFNIGQIKVEAFEANHPNGAFGYKFTFPSGRTFVHISDNGPMFNDGRLIDKIKGADYLSHDAQYLAEEYASKKQFGHSPYQYVIDIAKQGGVKNVILFHHDPMRTDKGVLKIESSARKLSKKIGLKAKVFAAREGMIIRI